MRSFSKNDKSLVRNFLKYKKLQKLKKKKERKELSKTSYKYTKTLRKTPPDLIKKFCENCVNCKKLKLKNVRKCMFWKICK